MYMRLSVERLRGLRSLELDDLRRVNLLAGPTACGLTTMLEGAFLVTGPANPSLPLKINQFRRFGPVDEHFWRPLFYRLDAEAGAKVEAELRDPLEKRRLRLLPGDPEEAGPPPGDVLRLEYDFSRGMKDAPAHVSTRCLRKANQFELKAAKGYQEARRGAFLCAASLGADVGRRLHGAQVKKRVESILDALKPMQPALLDLTLGAQGAVYADVGLPQMTPVSALGDGFLKALSIVLAVVEAEEGGVVLVDDMGAGFGDTSLRALWRFVIATARTLDAQVIAATHSTRCARIFAEVARDLDPGDADGAVYVVEKGPEDPFLRERCVPSGLPDLTASDTWPL